MTADIISMPERPKGNGAREALIEMAPFAMLKDSEEWADYILFKLAFCGFVIVPFEDK